MLPHEAQRLMRHSAINLTMKYYVHISRSDKARAIAKLPSTRPSPTKHAKTGTCDTDEDLIPNSIVNPAKIEQNPAKSTMPRKSEGEVVSNVNPFDSNGLGAKAKIRLAGFGPATYGLEIRCSIQLSYRRTIL